MKSETLRRLSCCVWNIVRIRRDGYCETAHPLSLLVQDSMSCKDITGDAEDEYFKDGLEIIGPQRKG